ncbi:MAG TPA: hypothetical protein PLB18_11745 [Acidobacteriota bacterium]|nr:hypothetical protein [Acidobacteriota bacterium]
MRGIGSQPGFRVIGRLVQTELPENIVTTTDFLCESGLADPKNGEYRDIEITTATVWGNSGPTKTHGWVLPSGSNPDIPRVAIAWNGQLYPVLAIGEKASLADDIKQLLDQDKALRQKFKQTSPTAVFSRPTYATPESQAVSTQELTPLKMCLLLRVGERELATQVWNVWKEGVTPEANQTSGSATDPFLRLAGDWLWMRFDRGINAHLRGEDDLARTIFVELETIVPRIEAEARRRGLLPTGETHAGQASSFFPFLKQIPALVRDHARRQTDHPASSGVASSLQARLEALPDKLAQITTLVADLDLVAARQKAAGAGVSLTEDPIVRALYRQGEDAVPALLNVIETNDPRLTRSITFYRDYDRDRRALSVQEVAYFLITRLLEIDFGSGSELVIGTAESRTALVTHLREYWSKAKSLTAPERWFQVLADDTASPDQWLQVVENIVSRDLPSSVPDEMTAGRALRGAVLRAKASPSVSDLVARRVESLMEQFQTSEEFGVLEQATQLVLFLTEWDEASARPIASGHMQALLKMYSSPGGARRGIGPLISRLTQARVLIKDRTALDEYAAWLEPISPEQAGNMTDLLKPLWLNADHPACQRAAERMFLQATSPWNPLVAKHNTYLDLQMPVILTTPLVGLPAVREQMLQGLQNKTPIGTVKVLKDAALDIQTQIGWQLSQSGVSADIRSIPVGTTIPFRVCDLHAWLLSALPGTPPCELFWPLAKRNQAILACSRFLKQFGSRYQIRQSDRLEWNSDAANRAQLRFGPFSQPATAADVRQGQAVFAFPPAAKSRLFPGIRLPQEAVWVNRKQFPIVRQSVTEAGDLKTEIQFEQRGTIWQAEEVVQRGQQERFYGFVGKYELARVPAAEVEFPGEPWIWEPLKTGWDVNVSLPTALRKGTFWLTTLNPSDALPLTIWLRNRRGVDQPMASALFQSGQGERPANLTEGVSVSVFYSPDPLSEAEIQAYQLHTTRTWTELPIHISTQPGFASPVMLLPTQAMKVIETDLRTLVDLKSSGVYRVRVRFNLKKPALVSGESGELVINLRLIQPKAAGEPAPDLF